MRIFVVGGYPNSPIPTQVYAIVADKWSNAAQMISPNIGIAVASSEGKLYTFGGELPSDWNSSKKGETQDTTEMYIPAVITASTSPTPTPSVPEFQWLAIPLLLVVMITVGLLVYFKKHKR